jgi:hypothetical protein
MTIFKRRNKNGKTTIIIGKKVSKQDRLNMAESFDAYKKGKPGLLEKYGIIANKRRMENPYK